VTRPPDKSIFFIDECSGIKLLREHIQNAGDTVKTNCDCQLPNGCEDHEWIRIVAENGWCFITHDKRILDNSNPSKKAIYEYSAAGFIVRVLNTPHDIWMPVLTKRVEKMHQMLRQYSRPFVATIHWASDDIRFEVKIGEKAGGKKK